MWREREKCTVHLQSLNERLLPHMDASSGKKNPTQFSRQSNPTHACFSVLLNFFFFLPFSFPPFSSLEPCSGFDDWVLMGAPFISRPKALRSSGISTSCFYLPANSLHYAQIPSTPLDLGLSGIAEQDTSKARRHLHVSMHLHPAA